MVFYVDTLYIAQSFHAYSPPSFSGSEMGIAPPPLALHIFPGVAGHAQHQASNIPPSELLGGPPALQTRSICTLVHAAQRKVRWRNERCGVQRKVRCSLVSMFTGAYGAARRWARFARHIFKKLPPG